MTTYINPRILKLLATAERAPKSEAERNEADTALRMAIEMVRREGIRISERLVESESIYDERASSEVFMENGHLRRDCAIFKKEAEELRKKVERRDARIAALVNRQDEDKLALYKARAETKAAKEREKAAKEEIKEEQRARKQAERQKAASDERAGAAEAESEDLRRALAEALAITNATPAAQAPVEAPASDVGTEAPEGDYASVEASESIAEVDGAEAMQGVAQPTDGAEPEPVREAESAEAPAPLDARNAALAAQVLCAYFSSPENRVAPADLAGVVDVVTTAFGVSVAAPREDVVATHSRPAARRKRRRAASP